MPRRNRRKKPTAQCSCGKNISVETISTHARKCARAYRHRRASRGFRYPEGV